MKRFLLLVSAALLAVSAAQAQPVRYSEYGAKGDGKTDDFAAIVKAHAAANKAGRPVQADPGATYYIAGKNLTAEIQTDTDWGDAAFIIDDRHAENHRAWVFTVTSKLAPVRVKSVKTLKKNQEKLDLSLEYGSCIVATDDNTMRYIRFGKNQNAGQRQTDVFIVDREGNVDMRAPIIWDFDRISSMTAYPIDPETLTVKGGRFTTIANQVVSNEYYSRGINVRRSNTVIDGVYHDIDEGTGPGSAYNGFISVSNCAGVTVQNCKLSGHKVYPKLGVKGVSKGTYDVSVNRAVNTTFVDCKQINDINDRSLWGIFCSNYSKNIVFDGVEFSRFDAHQGVANATIRNSVLGYMGVTLIGHGTFLIENTRICAAAFINLRGDYGSTWDGEVVIRNCEFVPRNGAQSDAVLFNARNTGQHDFGYTCHMPSRITIDGLVIDDTNPVSGYRGPRLFSNPNSANTSEAYREPYPYVTPEEVIIKELKTKSGMPYIVSDNSYMFRNVKITEK